MNEPDFLFTAVVEQLAELGADDLDAWSAGFADFPLSAPAASGAASSSSFLLFPEFSALPLLVEQTPEVDISGMLKSITESTSDDEFRPLLLPTRDGRVPCEPWGVVPLM